MKNSQLVLQEIIASRNPGSESSLQSPSPDFLRPRLEQMNSYEMAEIYVDSAFLFSAITFLRDERWLEQKKITQPNSSSLYDFLGSYFDHELAIISYLKSTVASVASVGELKGIERQAQFTERGTIAVMQKRSYLEQKIFAAHALELMSQVFRLESQLQADKKLLGQHLGLSLYRTFDRLDDLFALNYQADVGMKTDLTGTERLYEGAGVGVQSGYSTVVTALDHLGLAQGARFIDLGSGYGRVGLIVGLLRPDIEFVGYEFVPHRVHIANAATQNLGLQNKVEFFTQDLSLKSFVIPEAEAYYMYDPFSEETYSHVLNQLVAIARRRPIIIVTKGNARKWLVNVATLEGWGHIEEHDSGNLCFFRSAV